MTLLNIVIPTGVPLGTEWRDLLRKKVGTQNEIRENTMIGNKTTGAGLAFLLALSSLLLVPQAALAQTCPGATVTAPPSADVECVDGTQDVFVTNSTGNIAVTYDGDITVYEGPSGNTDVGTITIDSSGGSGTTLIDINTDPDTASDGGGRRMGALDATVGSGGLTFNLQRLEGQDIASSVNGVTVRGTGAAVFNLSGEIPVLTGNPGQFSNQVNIESFAVLKNRVDFSDLDGGGTINIGRGGFWVLSGDESSVLSDAADTVHIGAGGYMGLPIFTNSGGTMDSDDFRGIPPSGMTRTRTVDFGGGDDVLVNEGRILLGTEKIHISSRVSIGDYAGTSRTRYYAELRLENLETFQNNGEIWMGSSYRSDGANINEVLGTFEEMLRAQGTDRAADDILSLPGATFVGGPNSRILLDIDLNSLSGEQDRCDASIRDSNNQLPVADCINLQNGAAEGVTRIVFTDTSAGGRGAYNPNGAVIVDMSDGNGGPGTGAGGQTGNFSFDPATRYYTPNFGGALDNGMFMTSISYDEDMKQFRVITIPSAGAHHQTLIANGAQSAWRTANGSFFDRQADLRDTLRGEQIDDHGVWLRVAHDAAERDTRQAFATAAGDIVYDNTHDIDTDSVTLGVDFVRGAGAGHWVAGGMIGYVRTDMKYQIWTDTAAMNGMLVGAYGSYVNGPLFVNAAVSGIWAKLDQDIPQAELFDDRELQSNVETRGAQIEAGWRFDLGIARVEPLLNASWVETEVDDFKVPEGDPLKPGNQVMFDDTTSQRIGLGLRGSREFTLQNDVTLGLSLTGRVQEELDGKATAKIGNLNPISPEVKDEFDGTFGEVIGGVTLANSTGRVSGVLNVGSKFGDDYEALSGSVSFRYQW